MSQGAKRKKAQISSQSRKKVKTNSKSGSIAKSGTAIAGDKLRWKEVDISKHLDDAEGFYGLEEIEGVEVVRPYDGNAVLFKPTVGTSSVTSASSEGDNKIVEEWAGFEDEVENGTFALPSDAITNGAQAGRQSPTNKQEETSIKKGEAGRDEKLGENVDFTVLNGDSGDLGIDMSAWSELQLLPQLVSALSHLGFATPTKIQQAAIPPVLSCKDVIGKAVTGSGKTLAFGIPIVQSWLKSNAQKTTKGSIALLLAPTRELAHQITKHLTMLCEYLDHRPRIATVTGGLSVLKQQRQLETADIIVATPGRLWEVISESSDLLKKLKRLEFLVVDEADRLLSEGHFQEVEDILDALDRKNVEDGKDERDETKQKITRQTLVFSATFHKDLQQKLASKQKKRGSKEVDLLSDKKSIEYLMHKLPFQEDQKPVFVDANPHSQMAENLTETILECGAMQKDLYLYAYLLQDQQQRKKRSSSLDGSSSEAAASRILVFANSVSAVKRLVPLLQNLELPLTSIVPLHSNMPQKSRLRSLERFSGTTVTSSQPTTSVLIATDVAARGLDVKGITTIVHYHVPRTADTYVHRSGRTARVNSFGSSILLCSPEETASVTKLIAKIHNGGQMKSQKELNKVIDRMYLSNDLIRQVQKRIELAQKLVESSQSTDKVKSEDNWLRSAAADLGVDYDSEEFENAGKQGHRGRGGGKDRKQKQVANDENRRGQMAAWKAQLKEDLQRRIDFGDGMGRSGMKYLAGGAFDVDKLLAERTLA